MAESAQESQEKQARQVQEQIDKLHESVQKYYKFLHRNLEGERLGATVSKSIDLILWLCEERVLGFAGPVTPEEKKVEAKVTAGNN